MKGSFKEVATHRLRATGLEASSKVSLVNIYIRENALEEQNYLRSRLILRETTVTAVERDRNDGEGFCMFERNSHTV